MPNCLFFCLEVSIWEGVAFVFLFGGAGHLFILYLGGDGHLSIFNLRPGLAGWLAGHRLAGWLAGPSTPGRPTG